MNKLFQIVIIIFISIIFSSCEIPPSACAVCTNLNYNTHRTVHVENMCYHSILNCRRRWSENYSLSEPSFFNLQDYILST